MDARHTKTNSDFNLIYEAAKSDNTEALIGLMDRNVCVDVHDNRGLFTPAARLAAEGHHEAVKLLQGLGANCDYIAMGYASKGYVAEAETMRKKFGANIKCVAFGAAMHADSAYAEMLRQKFNLNTEWLISGASCAGRESYVAALLQRDKHKKSIEKSMSARIKGLVLGGFETEALAILDVNKESESDLLLRVAIEAAARVSNVDFLNKLLVRNGKIPHILDYYHQAAAIGAAKGGNLALAKELSKLTNRRDEQVSLIAAAGVKHGHLNETAKYFFDLLKSDQSSFITHQLALRSTLRGKHRHVVDKISKMSGALTGSLSNYNDFAALCARHGDLSVAMSFYKSHNVLPIDIVKAMDKGGHFYNEKLLTHALAFVDDHAFVDALSNAALVLNSDQDAARSVKTLYQGFNAIFENKCFTSFKQCASKAKQINRLMKNYNFNFDQAATFFKSKELRDIMFSLIFSNLAMCVFKNVSSGLTSRDKDSGLVLVGAEDLSPSDLSEMVEKLAFSMAKKYLDTELNEYMSRNLVAKYTYRQQHYDRAYSLQAATPAAQTRAELKSLADFQHKLFDGTIMVIADANRPKHEQPLSRPIAKEDDMYVTIDKINKNPRLNN